MLYRGEIWWANLPNPVGSEPGYEWVHYRTICKQKLMRDYESSYPFKIMIEKSV
jgi:hypothetical protein